MKVPSRLHHLFQFQVIYDSFLVTKDLLPRGKGMSFANFFEAVLKEISVM